LQCIESLAHHPEAERILAQTSIILFLKSESRLTHALWPVHNTSKNIFVESHLITVTSQKVDSNTPASTLPPYSNIVTFVAMEEYLSTGHRKQSTTLSIDLI